MKCPQCGKSNPEGAKFCGGCGISLDNKVELISNKENSAEGSASDKDSSSANKFSIDASIRAGIQKMLNRHGKKKVALIGGGVAIVLVAAIVAAVMVLNAGPSEAEFKSAVEANKTVWAQNSSSSSYGPDGAYKVMSVDDITSTKSKMPQGLLSSSLRLNRTV